MSVVSPDRISLAPMRLRSLLHIGLVLGLTVSPLAVSTSLAQSASQQRFEVPAGNLGTALTRFAGQAGVSVSVDPALVSGLRSNGLSGEYSVDEGFARLLQGTGLQLQPVGSGGYTLVPLAQSGDAQQLSAISVVGENAGSNAGGDVYPGGQVARRSSQGLLGSRDFMETPFSITTYTSETVKNQNARTLGDLIANDPSIQSTNPAGGRFEQFTVRGFSLFNSDVAFNGLYGIMPTYSIDTEMAERVDVIKGPSQLINGISPRGAVGGGVNLVSKRATDAPITEFTGNYASNSQVGGALDVGRRFGDNNQWGVRFNGVKQTGDTEWDNQHVDRQMGLIGLDYRGERLRLSADVGRTERDTDAPQERVLLGAGVSVPDADRVHDNYAQAWSNAKTKDTFGMFNGEFDLSDSLLVYGSAGARESSHRFLRHNVSLDNDAGDFRVQPRAFDRDESVRTANGGLRKFLDTGPVSHEINLAGTYFYMDFTNSGNRYARSPSNLYDPVATPTPVTSVRTDTRTYTENRFSAVALSDTLGFMDERLLVTLGTRWQRVKVDDWANGVKGNTAYDETKVSPSGGILFKVNDQLSLYGNYMEGLSEGKIAPSTSVNNDEIFPPFISRQIEVGAKYDHGTFGLTVAAFRIKQPAYEVNAATNRFGPNGKRENRGLEISTFGEPIDGVRVLGGLMYIDSELTGTNDGLADGNRAPATPKYSANLGLEWDVPAVSGLTLTGRANHVSSQYMDQGNSLKIDSWERYDLGARYAFSAAGKDITLRANVENVLDDRSWISAGASDASSPGLTLSAPRTYLMSATIGF